MIQWIKKLWNKESGGLTAAAIIIGVSSAGSRVLGVVRDRVLASIFGAGHELDLYYAAFRLPDTVYTLLIIGALSAGFIPVFAETIEKYGKEQAKKLVSQLLVVVGVILLVAAIGIVITAPMLLPLVFPSFKGEYLEQLVFLTRIMALSPFLLGLSSVAGGVLQVTKRYVAFAVAPMLYNVGIIIGAGFFGEQYGIQAVAWGVIAGAFAHAASQLVAISSMGFVGFERFRGFAKGLKQILQLMGPRILGLGVSQFSLTVLLSIAAFTGAGSVSALQFATNLQSFPLGVFGLSLAMAAFPLLSQSYAKEEFESFRKTFSSATRQIFFYLLPSTAIFFLLRAQIVRLVLGQGRFDWTDTILTADILGYLAFALVAQALIPLFARAFYSMQNTWLPFLVGLFGEAFTIFCAWTFREELGSIGIAIAIAVGSWIQLLLHAFLLRRTFGKYAKGDSFVSAYKTTVATIAFCVAGFPVREYLGTIFPLRTVWQLALQAGGTLLAGGLAFFIVANLVKSEELAELVQTVKRRLWKRVGAKNLDEEGILL